MFEELRWLAHREQLVEDPDYEPKRVRWVVEYGPGGKFVGVKSRETTNDKGKPQARDMQVPRSPTRAFGSVANFLVDKPEYALGFDPDDKPEKVGKLARHRQLFAEYVEAALAHAPDDPGLTDLLKLLWDNAAVAAAVAQLRGRAVGNDLVAFRYRDRPPGNLVHHRDAVKKAWRAMRNPEPPPGSLIAECLVCGTQAPPVSKHVMVKYVPGGSTSGIAFVSANAPAFESLGLEGVKGAPICRACAEAVGTALNRLFHPSYMGHAQEPLPRRSFRVSEDTALVYWASRECTLERDISGMNYADADEAGRFLDAIYEGGARSLEEPGRFHALLVSGGQGRATIRGYQQLALVDARKNLLAYVEDLELVNRQAEAETFPPLYRLVRALAAQGELKNVAPDLAGRLIRAALGGGPFPASVLAAAVRRIRAERDDPAKGRYKHTRERVALIRATLNRWFDRRDDRITPHLQRRIPPMLDESCTSSAYVLGRLFAVLERLQADAIGKPNASIADRFYGAASSTPSLVFGALMRKAQVHSRKAKIARLDIKIQEIMDRLDPADAFPTTLSLAEQGLFALGYYHQRADLWRKKAQAPAELEPVASE